MDLLRGYIQYLRDVSRKIVNRAGFENVLPAETRKKKNYYYNLDNYSNIVELFKDDEYTIPQSERQFANYVKTVNSFLQSSDEHRWFFGLGIVHGKYEGSSLLAPLVTVICNINSADDGNLQINIDEQSYQVNYDLLAKFLNIKIDEEADEERILTQEEEDKFRAIEEIENEIFSSARRNRIPDTSEIFRKLKSRISNFQQVQENAVKISEEDLIDSENIQDAPNSPNENWKYKPSNFESEFEFKVAEHLTDFINKHPEIEIFNQVNACGQKRLDFVLYNRNKKITCAVEVDGVNHFIGDSRNYTEAHLERVEILRRAKWQIVNVKYHNWYSNGWLCDKDNGTFADELQTLFKNLNELLQTDSN